MKILRLFQFEEQNVRTLVIDDEPYFVGKDVAEILGYAKPRNAISVHVDDEDKKDAPIQGTLGGVQTMTMVNESGLYSLILSSKLPTAKKFKRWVTSEVLPTIRKHGAYMTEQKIEEALLNPDTLITLAKQLKAEKKQRLLAQKQVEEMTPKALFADAVATSNRSILVGELAKLIRQNGVDIGQNRLFIWLREHGYLIKRKGTDYNMPTQKAVAMGLFQIKETSITHSNGTITLTKTAKVTGKGQQYFINKFLCSQRVLPVIERS